MLNKLTKNKNIMLLNRNIILFPLSLIFMNHLCFYGQSVTAMNKLGGIIHCLNRFYCLKIISIVYVYVEKN